jgi:hypothetical protein
LAADGGSLPHLNRKAYKPQVVSLGPFHHRRDGELLPMEEHKERVLWHLPRRSKRPLEEFAAAVADVAEQLESAYLNLGAEWRVADGQERFLEMMIVDGCFLLEVIKAIEMDGRNVVSDYAPNDPIFSHHGVHQKGRPDPRCLQPPTPPADLIQGLCCDSF